MLLRILGFGVLLCVHVLAAAAPELLSQKIYIKSVRPQVAVRGNTVTWVLIHPLPLSRVAMQRLLPKTVHIYQWTRYKNHTVCRFRFPSDWKVRHQQERKRCVIEFLKSTKKPTKKVAKEKSSSPKAVKAVKKTAQEKVEPKAFHITYDQPDDHVKICLPEDFFQYPSSIFIDRKTLYIVVKGTVPSWSIHRVSRDLPINLEALSVTKIPGGALWKLPIPDTHQVSVDIEDDKKFLLIGPKVLISKNLHTLTRKISPSPDGKKVNVQDKDLSLFIFRDGTRVYYTLTTKDVFRGLYTPRDFLAFYFRSTLQGLCLGSVSQDLDILPTPSGWFIPLPKNFTLSSEKDRYESQKIISQGAYFPEKFWQGHPQTFASQGATAFDEYITQFKRYLQNYQGKEAYDVLSLVCDQYLDFAQDSHAQILKGISLYLKQDYAQALSIFMRDDLPEDGMFWRAVCFLKTYAFIPMGFKLLESHVLWIHHYPDSIQMAVGLDILDTALDFENRFLSEKMVQILEKKTKLPSQDMWYKELRERFILTFSQPSSPKFFLQSQAYFLHGLRTYYKAEAFLKDLRWQWVNKKLSEPELIERILLLRQTWKHKPLAFEATYLLAEIYQNSQHKQKALEEYHRYLLNKDVQKNPILYQRAWYQASDLLSEILQQKSVSPKEKIHTYRRYHEYFPHELSRRAEILTTVLDAVRSSFIFQEMLPFIISESKKHLFPPKVWALDAVEIYRRLQRPKDAAQCMESWPLKEKDLNDAWRILHAQCWKDANHHDKSLALLEQNTSIKGISAYVSALMDAKQWQKVIVVTDRVLEKTPEPDWVIQRVQAAIFLKHFQELPLLREKYYVLMKKTQKHFQQFLLLTHHFHNVADLNDLQFRLKSLDMLLYPGKATELA